MGSNRPFKLDVRVVSATNVNLEEEVLKGNFREDLFYRLNVIPFYVPALRERPEDIVHRGGHAGTAKWRDEERREAGDHRDPDTDGQE